MAGPTATKSGKDKRTDWAAAHSQEQSRRPTPSGPQADVLALQLAAGNRAVNQLMGTGASSKPPPVGGVPQIVEDALKSGGEPLDLRTQEFMESRFEQDFSQVRVHTDARAAESAASISARAYTAGHDIVFGAAQYAPSTPSGKTVIAHELAHVLQQRDPENTSQGQLSLGHPWSHWEQEAEQFAHRADHRDHAQFLAPAADGGPAGSYISSAPAGMIQRQLIGRRESFVDVTGMDIAGAIHSGWRAIAEVDAEILKQANVAQRGEMIKQLAAAYWTGNREEEAIIRIINTTPHNQAAELLKQLTDQELNGRSLLDELDRVVDTGNNLDLHAALSMLRLKGLGVEKTHEAMEKAPILPWSESGAVFSVSWTRTGKVRVKYPALVFGRKGQFEEIRRLPNELFGGGHDYDPEQILLIRDYDRMDDKDLAEGKKSDLVPIVARELSGYRHAARRIFLTDVAEIASIALPGGAAKSAIREAALFIVGKIIPTVSLLIRKNRLQLLKWFPNWGPRIIKTIQTVELTITYFGIGRMVRAIGSRILKGLSNLRGQRAILDPPAPTAEAEQIARKIEVQADDLSHQIKTIQGGQADAGEAAAKALTGTGRPRTGARLSDETAPPMIKTRRDKKSTPGTAAQQSVHRDPRSFDPDSPAPVRDVQPRIVEGEAKVNAADTAKNAVSSDAAAGGQPQKSAMSSAGSKVTPAAGGGGDDALALLEGGSETGGFKAEGPLVAVPASKEGKPARVLEVGSGPRPTNLGLPPEESLVMVTPTDIRPRPGADFLDATRPVPSHLVGKYDTVIINNPRRYQPNIPELGKALRPDGRIISQGKGEMRPGQRGINPDFQKLLDAPRHLDTAKPLMSHPALQANQHSQQTSWEDHSTEQQANLLVRRTRGLFMKRFLPLRHRLKHSRRPHRPQQDRLKRRRLQQRRLRPRKPRGRRFCPQSRLV